MSNWAGSRGEGRNWQPPGWAKLRRRVFKRDGNRCVKCRSTDRLECDHIDGCDDHSMMNLQTLCHDCHAEKTQREAAAARRQRRAAEREPELHPGIIR